MVMAADPFSPDQDTFSTPPTTPAPENFIRPSISRRNSRPSSLLLGSPDRNTDIVVETSPDIQKKLNGVFAATINNDSATAPAPAVPMEHPPKHLTSLPKSAAASSPCFVHSYLDKGAALTDWLHSKYNASPAGDVGVARSLQHHHSQSAQPTTIDSGDDDGFGGSLTKQLAETAVSVREMSKQLGQTTVKSNIQSILIITKARDNRLIKLTRDLALYLMFKKRSGQQRGLIVYVDNQLRKSRRFNAEGLQRDHPDLFVPFPLRRHSSSASVSSNSDSSSPSYHEEGDGQLRYWTMDMCNQSPHLFDFVVTLGGDGTVLFTSWLFQRIVPPVLPFALGSLGFLTNFDFNDHQAVMDSVIDSGIRVNLRMRFTCTVYRAVAQEKGKGRKAVKKAQTGEIMMKDLEKGGWEALEGGFAAPEVYGKTGKDKEIMCFTTRPAETFEVINELVVDRGPSPYVSLLELFGDEHHMTTVQADGLTVSTPTGSTAYSLSAGGSLVHPEIPALLITPICPHTLSFRPMLLPDTMELRICVPFNSRSTAWASFDGRGRVELKQGDHIKVTASKYPFPTVCADKQSTDWFHAISRTLKWNERERQKSFVVVEEGPARRKSKGDKQGNKAVDPPPDVAVEQESGSSDEEDEVSDEEEEFDIDSAPDGGPPEPKPKKEADHRHDRKSRGLLHAPGLDLNKPTRGKSRSRSRSRNAALRSGIETPGRFARVDPGRHVGFNLSNQIPSPTNSASSADSGPTEADQNGARDDIHSRQFRLGAKSRIPRDRDLDVKTPTALHLTHRGRAHSRSRSADHGPRAFAAWGQDESDSNASDSDY